jgi:ABC-type multidrug transport system fused ATPase/permease subunit
LHREVPELKKEDIDALRGGIGGEIAFLIQNLASVASGFVISLIKNWKLTLVMLMAAPFMGAVEAFVAKVSIFT